MTPVGVQRRRAALRAVGRRHPGGPGRSVADPNPRLFPDRPAAAAGLDTPAPRDVRAAVDAPVSVGTPTSGRAPAVPASRSELAGRGEGETLAELVGRLWEGILTEGRATCPLCGGELVGRASAHARATEGRCQDCGTTIG